MERSIIPGLVVVDLLASLSLSLSLFVLLLLLLPPPPFPTRSGGRGIGAATENETSLLFTSTIDNDGGSIPSPKTDEWSMVHCSLRIPDATRRICLGDVGEDRILPRWDRVRIHHLFGRFGTVMFLVSIP